MTDAVTHTLRQQIAHLQGQLKAARAELAFYADPENCREQKPYILSEKGTCRATTRPPVMLDGGERARKVK